MKMSLKEKILVIEDDSGIAKFLKATLNANGYDVTIADTGSSALSLISSNRPDVILLDLGLPDMDGNSIIQEVRQWTKTPIIVISARSTETDKANALDLGADDYIIKPFGTIELMARIRTALRHTRTTLDNDEIALTGTYKVGELTVDFKKRKVFRSGEDTKLTSNEFRIVSMLSTHPGQVMTYKHMLTELWGPSATSDNKILRVHMANIRRKIEPNPNEPMYIFTEVGVGYRMAESEDM